LQALRLGDFVNYNSKTLEVTSLTEYKTSNKSPSNIENTFKTKFLKSPVIDKQFLDLQTRTIFQQRTGDISILATDLNEINFNDEQLTFYFDKSRRLATQRTIKPILQNNIVEYSIQQIKKFIK
jgi:hypothetical protein